MWALILCILILLAYILYEKREMFTSSGINISDESYNPYGNINTTEIDTTTQATYHLPFEGNNNNDVIDSLVNPPTIFQPINGGVSPTTNASMSNFTLAGPSGLPYFDDPTDYDIPQQYYSLDENMARKQQHISSVNKKALEGSVRNTRNVFEKYFLPELTENANREWWDDSSEANLETDFSQDIYPN